MESQKMVVIDSAKFTALLEKNAYLARRETELLQRVYQLMEENVALMSEQCELMDQTTVLLDCRDQLMQEKIDLEQENLDLIQGQIELQEKVGMLQEKNLKLAEAAEGARAQVGSLDNDNRRQELLDKPLEILNLTERQLTILHEAQTNNKRLNTLEIYFLMAGGIQTVGDLLGFSETDLGHLIGFSVKDVAGISNALGKIGLQLAQSSITSQVEHLKVESMIELGCRRKQCKEMLNQPLSVITDLVDYAARKYSKIPGTVVNGRELNVISDLTQCTLTELLSLRGIGQNVVGLLERQLWFYGLQFASESVPVSEERRQEILDMDICKLLESSHHIFSDDIERLQHPELNGKELPSIKTVRDFIAYSSGEICSILDRGHNPSISYISNDINYLLRCYGLELRHD